MSKALRLTLFLLLVPMIFFASDSEQTEQQQRWFSSFSNNASAQYQTATTFWHQRQRSAALYWWQRAAQQGSEAALKALTQHFPSQRRRWLAIGAEQHHEPSLRALAAEQLTQPEISWQQWRSRWITPEYAFLSEYRHLHELIDRHCADAERIDVVGGSNAQKGRFVEILNDIERLDLPVGNWCFQWQLRDDLQCTVGNESERAECAFTESVDGRRIVLAAAGKSSSSPSRITLAEHSGRGVLAHELGHWLGFADEYQMSEPLANAFCRGHYRFDPLNLVVTGSQQLSEQQLRDLWERLPWRAEVADWRELGERLPNGQWLLGSRHDQVGLHRAATCGRIAGYYAWKPLAQPTPMERHQLLEWPELYKKLAAQALMAN